VLADVADPHHFVLHEVYADEAAVQAHRAAPHFRRWRAAADLCLQEGSQVNTLCTPVRSSIDAQPGGAA